MHVLRCLLRLRTFVEKNGIAAVGIDIYKLNTPLPTPSAGPAKKYLAGCLYSETSKQLRLPLQDI